MAAATGAHQAEIDKTVAQLNKVVKKAHVDLWVGKSDHKVHRVAFSVDAAMDDATKQSSGIDSARVNLDVTTVDTSAPDMSAPSSVGTPGGVPGGPHGPARQGHERRRQRLSRPARSTFGTARGRATARPLAMVPARCARRRSSFCSTSISR